MSPMIGPILFKDSGRNSRPDVKRYYLTRVHWSQLVWYGDQRDLLRPQARIFGREHEVYAKNHIFTHEGISKVIDLAEIVSSSPFDFVGSINGHRVAIDVTAKWQRRVDKKAPLATALGLPLYILMVCQRDRSFWFFTQVKPEAKTVRVPFALLRSIAEKHGVEYGR